MEKQIMDITIYSTPTCHFCIEAKAFFKEHKIKFKEIDVSENQEAAEKMKEISGQIGVPVIVINKEIILGFNQDKIKKALKLE